MDGIDNLRKVVYTSSPSHHKGSHAKVFLQALISSQGVSSVEEAFELVYQSKRFAMIFVVQDINQTL